jgi:hypothetical protein
VVIAPPRTTKRARPSPADCGDAPTPLDLLLSQIEAGGHDKARRWHDIQHRIETSRAGRFFVSIFLLVTVSAVVIENLPAGAVAQHAGSVVQPYLNATGLDQKWNMFAPNPRTEILYLQARILHADGRVTTWAPPHDGPLLGAYRNAHWNKFVEHAVIRPGDPDGWPQLWRPLALYIASLDSGDRSPPVSVTLIKRSAYLLPPGGDTPDHTPFREQPYYTLRLR